MDGTSQEARARSAYPDGRLTLQRRVLAKVVDATSGAFTAAAIARAARDRLPGLATATVYRALAAMEESGYITPVGSSEGAVLFARCGSSDHHHHAICERCGAIVCLACPVPDARFETTVSGFQVTRHEYRLYGVCQDCATSGRRARDDAAGDRA